MGSANAKLLSSVLAFEESALHCSLLLGQPDHPESIPTKLLSTADLDGSPYL